MLFKAAPVYRVFVREYTIAPVALILTKLPRCLAGEDAARVALCILGVSELLTL